MNGLVFQLASHQSHNAEIQAQADHDFLVDSAVLHRMATVALWAQLEAYVDDAMVALIDQDPSLLLQAKVRAVKGSLADHEVASREKRILRIVDGLARGERLSTVERHASMLEILGASGEPFPEELNKSMTELEATRHLLVHRRGVVDRRFRERCPWLSVAEGDDVDINDDRFAELVDDVRGYVEAILDRFRARR